jgi:hypothetical protein
VPESFVYFCVLSSRNERKDDNLFVDPGVAGLLPVDNLLGLEPQGDFLVGGIHRVGAVDDVAADVDAQIATDGARCRVLGVSGAQHHAAGLDDVHALPHHGHNRAEGNQTLQN